jgi:pre-mRNA-splicing factor ATP-dependent RNA helicase DHX15/PRP43
MRALELLNYLGALDDDGNLTSFGQLMSEFPLDPQFAKALMVSPRYGCSEDILTIIAMLNVPNPFIRPNNDRKNADAAKAQFDHDDGDHLTLLNAYNAYKENEGDSQWCFNNYLNVRSLKQADNVRQQLQRYLYRTDSNHAPTATDPAKHHLNIRKALTAGFFMQVAHLEQKGLYMTTKDNQVLQINLVCDVTSFLLLTI